MNFFLISYGDFDYDGRLRELHKVLSAMGTLYAVTRGSMPQNDRHRVYCGNYLRFIQKTVEYGKKMEQIDVLFLDNRKSVLPGLILRKLKKTKVVIQDCRELYVAKEVSHFAGKVGCFVEKWGIDRSNIIICANQERAALMQKMFGLRHMPIVYENLRRLEYSDDGVEKSLQEKFAGLIHDDEIRILSSSGCCVSRTNDVLVESLDKVNRKCRLLLVGSNTPEDERAIRKKVKEKNLDNVEILGLVNQDELKYLISISHVGIVNYHQKDTNNKYCASGKVYEFVYEGIPVVTTTNPPLKHMCDSAMIGVADDNYADGINQVMGRYEEYQRNVRNFAKENPVEGNNKQLIRKLSERLAQLTGNE